MPIGPGNFHNRKLGDVLHPQREPAWELEKLKRKMGSADFAAQYQQQPVPPGGNLIKWGWFRVYDKPPIRDVGDHTIVSWDTAMSAGELSDYSAGLVLHLKGEDAFILDVVRERLDYPDIRRKIIDSIVAGAIIPTATLC